VASTASHLPEERHELIDALRGFALAGVFLSNLAFLSLFRMLPHEQRAALETAAFDTRALQAIDVLVNDKFITLFSLLFGLGFALQLKRAEARGTGGLSRYVRRLAVLLVMGGVHAYFVWWGDILLTYAFTGLLLILFRGWSGPMLIAGGIVVAIVMPLLAGPLMDSVLPEIPPHGQRYREALQAFAGSDPLDVLHANATLATWTRVGNWPLLCFVLGRFLIGYWAGREQLLQHPAQHVGAIRRIFAWSLGLGIVLTLGYRNDATRLVLAGTDRETGVDFTQLVDGGSALALGIAYATGFVLLYLVPRWQRCLRVLAPAGRMALTHYLTQSLIGVALFYGIGLGIGPEGGVAPWLTVWAVVFALQVAASHVWLARFRYGPMEWLWRWLTDGTRPALRRYAVEPS
jgi:uncharacterized protein